MLRKGNREAQGRGARPGFAKTERRHSGGFTLLETLVAFAVLSIGILGYVALQFQSVNGRTFARSMNRASTAATASLEEMRTIDFDQLTGSGTAYRFKDCAGAAAESDYQDGNAYKIEWSVGDWNAITANCNSHLRALKTIHAVIRWKEKGVDYFTTFTTFDRGFKTGDIS